MSNIVFVPSLAILPDFARVSPTSIDYTLLYCYHRIHFHHIVDACTILYITILTPHFSQTSEGLFRSGIEAHPHSKIPSPWKDVISQPWKSDKGITSTSMTFLPKEELNGMPIDSSAPTSLISYLLDRDIPCNHVSLHITSPPFVNLRMIFI
jgi:hypothetical protein